MQKLTTPTQGELLHTQLNVDETHKQESSSKLIEREQIPDTPFWIYGSEEKGYFLVMGNNKMSETKETKEEAVELIIKEPFMLVLRMITAVFEKLEQLTKQI